MISLLYSVEYGVIVVVSWVWMAYVDSGVDVTVTYLSNAGESWQYLLNPTHSSEFW